MAAPIRTMTTPHSLTHTLTHTPPAAVMQLRSLRRRSALLPLLSLSLVRPQPPSPSLTSTHTPATLAGRQRCCCALQEPPGDEGYLQTLQERVALKMKGSGCLWVRCETFYLLFSVFWCRWEDNPSIHPQGLEEIMSRVLHRLSDKRPHYVSFYESFMFYSVTVKMFAGFVLL